MKHTHYWKIGLGLLGFIGLLLALTVATWAAEGEDLDPPHLVSLDFAPKTVDTSDADQTITFTMHITDDLSGVDYVRLYLESPSGKQYSDSYPCLNCGDTSDNVYIHDITLPRYSETGAWKIALITLEDRVTNGHTFYQDDLVTLGFPTQFTVTGTISDITPPQLVDLDFEPKTVDAAGTGIFPYTITFTAHITDNLSGVNYVQLYLETPAGERYFPDSHPTLVSGNALEGIYMANVGLPYSAGVWKVQEILFYDEVTNRRRFYESDLVDLGFPNQFTVTGTSDITPPHLVTFDIEPKVANTAQMSQRITFTARITDDLAGVGRWLFWFYSQSGQRLTSYSEGTISGEAQDYTYFKSAILPQYSEMGIWTLSRMDLYDLAYNRATLSIDDVAELGYPTQFLNGTPIPTNTQSTLVYPSPDGLTTTLDVPAGAVTDTTYLAYNNVSAVTDIPQGHTFAGRAFSLDAYRDMALLADFRFARPPTVTLAYDGAVVSGTRESNLLLAYWDGDTWVDIVDSCPGAVYVRRPERDHISVPVCHLSKFALLSREASGIPTVYIPLVLRNWRFE